MKKIKQYKLILSSFLVLGFMSANINAGTLQISQTGALKQNTARKACVNAQGFYFEIGKSPKPLAATFSRGEKMPLSSVIKYSVPKDWIVTLGAHVDSNMPMTFSGNFTWTNRLKRCAQNANLAIIVDWKIHHVYINKL